MNVIDYPGSQIYFIGAAVRGPVKIGTSMSPQVRLRDLQTASPYYLTVLAQHPGGLGSEAQLHEIFSAYRMVGEWFERTRKLKRLIELLRAKTELTDALHRVFRNDLRARNIIDNPLHAFRHTAD